MARPSRRPQRRRRPFPWNDPAGRFSWLKFAILLAMMAPGAVLLGDALVGRLGAEPVEEAINRSGTWGVRFLLAALLVTPVRLVTGWSRLAMCRRLVGLGALAWLVLHFALFAVSYGGDLTVVAQEIALRLYLTIGFVALLLLAALGLTSFDRSVRWLGPATWQRLHRAAYLAGVLGVLHFLIQSRLSIDEPAIVAGLMAWGFAVRLMNRFRWRVWQGWAGVALLALAGGAVTAGIEFVWYDGFTGIPAHLVLVANADMAAWMRPAHWVALAILAIGTTGRLRGRFKPAGKGRHKARTGEPFGGGAARAGSG